MVTCDFCLPLKKLLYFGPNSFTIPKYFHALPWKVFAWFGLRIETVLAFQCIKSTQSKMNGLLYSGVLIIKWFFFAQNFWKTKVPNNGSFSLYYFFHTVWLSAIFPRMIVVIFRLAFATKLLFNFDSIMWIKCYTSKSHHTFTDSKELKATKTKTRERERKKNEDNCGLRQWGSHNPINF